MHFNSFSIQPDEQFYVYGSILKNQQSQESIVLSTSSVTITDKDGTDVTSSLKVSNTDTITDDPDGDYTDNAYAVCVMGGTEAASPYKITFSLHTNKGNIYEIDITMAVREI